VVFEAIDGIEMMFVGSQHQRLQIRHPPGHFVTSSLFQQIQLQGRA
jgi:hypothetical protein